MGFLTEWKIGRRLGACFAALCTLMAGMGLLAVVELGVVNGSVIDLRDNWLPSVKISSAANLQTSDYRVLELEHVASIDEARMKVLDEKILVQARLVEQSSAAYAKLVNSSEERKVFESFTTAWREYLAESAKVLAHSRKNENDEARKLLNGESYKHFEEAATALDRLVEINEAGANRSGQGAESTYSMARTLLIGVVLVAVLLAVVAAVMVTRSITAPLSQAIGFVEEVRDGDLRSRIEVSRRDELGQLLRAVADMQQGLANVVSGVRSNAESVATASAEIAQGNTDLSQRTEEQASALQQTAATMEELGATVKQNAENARQADQLAQGASAVAVQGGDVVGGLVSTMRGISDSSKRIADIIGTIDGIAFQTNILALNAAVEAARAGEQGRGFAVVAGEVRTLASRSAEAAKEIKALITASVERVEQGSAQADQAGQTMQEVVAAIRRVTDIMGEISAASGEQSNGIGQVGDAIGQMDQVTQQNAALVEEAAAAAESLKTQAAALVQGVAVFQLRHQ